MQTKYRLIRFFLNLVYSCLYCLRKEGIKAKAKKMTNLIDLDYSKMVKCS